MLPYPIDMSQQRPFSHTGYLGSVGIGPAFAIANQSLYGSTLAMR